MCLNVLKCSNVTFSLSRMAGSMSYQANGAGIMGSSSYRDLGVLVTSKLLWSEYISQLCSRAYGSLHLVKRTVPIASPAGLKRSIYLALVRSHFTYCSQLWRPNLLKDISTLERVQHHATKYILNNYVSDYKARITRNKAPFDGPKSVAFGSLARAAGRSFPG